MHHGSVRLGAGWQVLAVGLTEDAVLVVLLKQRQNITGLIDQVLVYLLIYKNSLIVFYMVW